MRQKTTTVVLIVAVCAVVAALVVFGLARSVEKRSDRASPEAAPAHAHGEHEQEAGAAPHDAGAGELALSGEVREGVRVVPIAARRFEFDPATVVVKPGEMVRLEVASEDVTHGIAIEAYGIDRALEPGKTEVIEFTADKPGEHHFHCSVYCGGGHADMHGTLIVKE